MADINIKCTECDVITSVSEFIDPNSITCKSCGRKLEIPQKENEIKPIDKLRLKKKEIPENGSEEAEVDSYFKPPQPIKATKKFTLEQHIMAWITFLALGTLMYFIRYREFLLDDTQRGIMMQFAPLVVVAFHILIVLKAFSDNVLHGILALFVPGYSFIYLLFISDDFYARAAFAGIMVGMGEDAWASISGYVMNIYNTVTEWLSWE